MSLAPDNFLFFICLFSISIFCGTYLVFSYEKTKLVNLSAAMFFLCAVRFCTEYYLPQIDDYATATRLASFHSVILFLVVMMLWISTYFYIRPFKKWKNESLINNVFLYGIVLIPSLVQSYTLATRKIHYFSQQKINGYWQFKAFDNWAASFHYLHAYLVMAILVIGLFMYSILADENDRLKKLILLIIFIVFPILYSKINFTSAQGWTIPASAVVLLSQVLIATWFVSGYRIFKDNFGLAVSDVLDSISDLIIKTDLDYNIEYQNSKTIALFGTAPATIVDFVSQNSSLTRFESLDFFKQLSMQAANTEILKLKDSSGITKNLEIKVSKLLKSKRLVGYTFLFTDLTQILAQQDELEKLNDTKDRLFTIIGHDLRKPALAFRGISKKIRRLIAKNDFDALDKFGLHIERSSYTLNSVLDNLLHWGVSQRGVSVTRPTAVDIKADLQVRLEQFQRLADNKGVEMKINITAEKSAYVDPNAYATIVRNVLDNAIKFTPTGGTIDVKVTDCDEGVILSISDTGIGMRKKLIEDLTNQSRIHSQKGTEGELGSGIGLSLVSELIEINKGSLSVLSEPGLGSTFNITLPAA